MKIKVLIILFVCIFMVACNKPEVFIREINLNYELETDKGVINTMIDYLESLDYKGNIKYEIVVERILNELPNRCYRVSLPYALVENIVVVEEGNIVSSIPGSYASKTYILDSNGDGIDELIYQSNIGAGLLLIQMFHYDFENHKILSGSFYNDNDDIVLDVKDNKIYAYSYYLAFDKRAVDPIGKLKFTDPLEIDNLN